MKAGSLTISKKVVSAVLAFIIWPVLLQSLIAATAEAQNKRKAKQRSIEFSPAEPIKDLPGKAKRWALIIGIDRYDDHNINQLAGAVNDAKAIEQALIKYAGFDKDHILRLTSDQPKDLQPNRSNIIKKLVFLKGVADKDGLLLFAFSGHGISSPDGKEAFLLPSNASMIRDIDYLTEEAISVSKIRESINKIGVKQRILILDACRDNPTGRGGGGSPMTEAFTRGFDFDRRNDKVNAFMALYATGMGQKAYENQNTSMGYFTEALVEGLKGGAADEATGEVTLGRLKDYIREKVRTRTVLDRGEPQEPWVQAEGYADDLVLAKVPVQPAISVAVPKTDMPSPPTNSRPPASATIEPALKEEAEYAKVEGSKSPQALEAFLKQYPDGTYAKRIQARLLALSPAPAKEPGEIRIESKVGPPVYADPKGSPKAQKRGDGVLFVLTSIPAANVVIKAPNFRKEGESKDGEFRAELAQGDYEIEVTAVKYSTFAGKVSIKRGKPTPVKVEMAPAVGSILITSVEPDAEVFLDGRKHIGETAKTANQIELADISAGPHSLRIVHPTILDWHRENIEVQGGAVTYVTPRFERSVAFSPAFSEYFKEGTRYWDAPAKWQVRANKLFVRGYGLGLLQKIYKDFTMEFEISLINGLGASWVVRARDDRNYYVFQITGSKSAVPNVFRGYVCQNGTLTRIVSDIPLGKDLAYSDKAFGIIVETNGDAIKNSIRVKSGPNAGRARLLSAFSGGIFSFGKVGFQAMSGEEFIVHFAQITPTN